MSTPADDTKAFLLGVAQATEGKRIPGGCDTCAAYQTVEADAHHAGVVHVSVWHDPWCLTLRRHQHRGRSRR